MCLRTGMRKWRTCGFLNRTFSENVARSLAFFSVFFDSAECNFMPRKAELHHKLFRRKIWARLGFISLFCLVLRHRGDEVRIALMQNDVTVTWRGNESRRREEILVNLFRFTMQRSDWCWLTIWWMKKKVSMIDFDCDYIGWCCATEKISHTARDFIWEDDSLF